MSMSLYCSSNLLWSYTSRWNITICVEKESSKRQTGLTCVNGTLLPLLLLLPSHLKLSWHTDFWEYGIAYIQNGSMWYVEIWNLNWRLLSEIVESFQPLGASPVFTTESDVESLHSVVCPCPLTSCTSCTQYKLAHLLLHQLYAVVADYINAFVE